MNKRNILIVAIMAMILMGSVVLSAEQITIYCNANPANVTFEHIHPSYATGTREWDLTCFAGSNSFNLDLPDGGWGIVNGVVYLPIPASDSDGPHAIETYGANPFYLDLNGNAIYDPYQPITQ